VISFDASVDGWGGVVCSSSEEKGTEIVGGYRLAAAILGRAFVDPAALPACPASQVYRETLAGFLATRAASQLHALADRTVLIRSDCTGAISALRKGSFRSPALQNVALLHNRLFMDVGASPPRYLHAPGTVMKAEGVDDLSRAVARSIRASSSTPALREKVAAGGSGPRSPSTSSLPQTTLWFPEPLAEGVDTLGPLSLPALWSAASGVRVRISAPGAAAGIRREGTSGRAAWHRHSPVHAFRSGVAGPRIRVANGHCRAEGPLPDPPELGSVRLRGGGPGRRSAPGHPGGRLQSLVLAVVGRCRHALCCPRGAPAEAFASEQSRAATPWPVT
jgi:hypothetical protein